MCGTGCLLIVQNFTAEIMCYKFDLENRDLGHNQAWLPLHVYMTLFPPLMTNPPPLPDATVREASPRFGTVTAWQAPLHKSTTDRRPRNHIRVLLAGFVLGLSLDTSPPAEAISFLRALNDFWCHRRVCSCQDRGVHWSWASVGWGRNGPGRPRLR
jgi:hypothetical protein